MRSVGEEIEIQREKRRRTLEIEQEKRPAGTEKRRRRGSRKGEGVGETMGRRNALKKSDSRGERNLNGNDNVTCQSHDSLK
ncbi:hypothetical protein QL285_025139 [Trifolium repens]|nr:hypothetical protein QL285_025139 [Trifolium repens]